MQKAQSNWVFLTWSLCFISKSFVNFFSLMFLFSFAFRICIELHSCISYQVDFVCFSKNFKKINIKKNGKRNVEGCVLYYISWMCTLGWSYYLYIICLCTLISLDELIFLHFTNFSYVVHVVCELFIVFNHMILILKSHIFYCKN